MTAFLENVNYGSEQVRFDITCEVDETLFMAVMFESDDGKTIEFQTDSHEDIEEFFRQVEEAKKDYYRLKADK
jgi:hypothetical protein